MSTAKALSLSPLKANVKIVGKGTNYLHLNITVSSEAPDGQTGDGIIIQPVNKGTPDKLRWKVYKRGKVTAIDGPDSVALGSRHTIVFRGSDMGRATMIPQSAKWSSANRTGRSQGTVTYSILFDKCNSGKVNIKPFLLVNQDLPPAFRNDITISGFRGNASKTVTITDASCGPPRIRGGAVMGSCPPGYYRPAANRGCIRR